MSKMQFQPFKSGFFGTFGSSDKVSFNPFYIFQRHCLRYFRQISTKCHSRRRYGLPTLWITVSKMIIAFPRTIGAGFTTSMCNLNTSTSTGFFNSRSNFCHAFSLLVIPYASASWSNSSFGADCGGFNNHQTRSTAC